MAGDDNRNSLVKEFEEWFRCHQSRVPIYLLEVSSNYDGCTMMKFSLAGEQDFVLRCPSSCAEGDRCLAEAGHGLHSWSKAINEFLLESPCVPSLSEVLTKAMELYLQKDMTESMSMGDSPSMTASFVPMTCDSTKSVRCGGSNESADAITCEPGHTGVESLIKEFEEWNKRTSYEALFLLEATSSPHGSTSLRFCLGGDDEFILHCPHSYSSPEDRFLVEAAARVNAWSTLLNEFLLDSPGIIRLQDALSKAVELYLREQRNHLKESSSEAEEEMDEIEEGSGEEIEIADDDLFTTEWELKITRKKKIWMEKELELRAQISKAQPASSEVRAKCSNLVDGLIGPSAHQIFSTHASSGVLTNDLIAIMEKGKEFGILAEPIDDNIYCWSVKMSRFAHNSPISEDLRIVHQLFGYKHIELQLDFMINLYPFYPPQLKVIRPRLQVALMQSISTLELLKLSQWNPACNLISILLEIKEFVQKFARLEAHRERNCPKRFPEGAYLPLDHHLLRLAMVSETSPRANSQFNLQRDNFVSTCENQLKISISNLLPALGTVVKKEDKKEYWASGTGYGHHNRPGWDVSAYMAAQNLKDRQIEAVLGTIVEDLQNDSRCTAGQAYSLPNQMEVQQPDKRCTDESADDLYEILEESALIPFLEFHLKVDSLLEVGRHVVLYKAIVGVITEIVKQPPLVRLLGPLPRQSSSIHRLLEKLKAQASAVLERLGKASAAASESVARSNLQEEDLAREFCKIYEDVKCAMDTQGITEDVCGDDQKLSNYEAEHAVVEGNVEEVIYCKCLKPLQLKNFRFLSTNGMSHAFGRAHTKSNPPSPKQVMRIAQELSSLSDSLPLSLSSSIFDDENCSLLRALITGPEGTPYSGGCFQFDVYFPSCYPQEPPKVQLMTTGKLTVRFNPNLYACGKVCLSLLGTWEGQKGEKWNEASTLLQVLISIQSLILVPEPYFNEPGYEVEIGTETGKQRSETYNKDVIINNIKWAMVDQLKNPTPGFEQVIRHHFSLRRASLLKEMHDWRKKFNTKALAAAVKQLEDQLNLLPEFEPT